MTPLKLKLSRRKTFNLAVSLVILGAATFIVRGITTPAMADWWTSQVNGTSWSQRKQLTLTNSSANTISSGTTVAVTVDTQALYNLSQLNPDCSDLRIVYQSGSTTTELTRHLVPSNASGCTTSSATKVYFQTQAALTSNSSSTDYYVYYHNPQATAPANTAAAFNVGATTALLVCPFDGTTTCAGAETPSTATGALRYSGSKTALSLNGVSDYISSGNIGSNIQTVEFWVYPFSTTNYFLDLNGSAYITASSGTITATGFDTPAYYVNGVATQTISANTWSHVAVVTATGLSGSATNVGKVLTNYYSGYIDEVRISTTQRYSGSFSPPTAPFTRDSHTALLYHFDENGSDPRNAGKAIDDSGNSYHGTITGSKYVAGLIGVDAGTSDASNQSSQGYSSHTGLFLEQGTTNKITNPSFENGTYDTNWSLTDTQVGTATVVTSAGTVINASGRPTQSHLIYAENSASWWVFYIDSTNTNQLKSKYSTNFTTWTSGATLTLARNHDSNGANFAVAYKNISSTDVIHVTITYNPSSTSHYNYHARGHISGTTLTWDTSPDTIVGAQNTNDTSGSTSTDGPNLGYDSNNKIWVGTGFANEPVNGYIGDNDVFLSTNADTGTSWTTGFQANPTEVNLATNQYESRFWASLGSGNMLEILDNNSVNGMYNNLQSYKYTGTWGANANVFASNITAQDTPMWGAVAVSPSDIHVVSFTNSTTTGAATHRRYNGSSWAAGATITNVGSTVKYGNSGQGENLFLSTDSTNVYMFAIKGDTANTVIYNKWSAAANTWGGWTNFETSTKTRHVITGYSNMANNTIGVLWAQNNSTNYDITVKPFGVSSVAQNTTAAYTKFGSNSAKVSTSIAADATYVTAINPASTSTHTLSAYVYRGTSGSVGGTIDNTVAQLVFRGTAQSTTSYTNMGNGWWRLSYSAAAANASENYGIKVFHGETVYLDSFQLELSASATTYTDGSLGTGYAWTGTANNSTSTRTVTDLEYPATANNISPTAGAISLWLKPAWAGNDGVLHEILAVTTTSGTFRLYKDTDNSLKFYDGSHTASSAVSWSANTWQFLTIDWGSNNMHVYVNGTAGTAAGAFTAPTINTSGFIYVGENAALANLTNGIFSRLTIWDGILTSTQVTDQYSADLVSYSPDRVVDAFSGPKGQNPVALWHMDESQGSTAYDSSTYTNHLILSNVTWNSDSSAVPTQRRVNLQFNGSSSKASLPWNSNFNFGTNPFTISGWFRHPSTISGTQTILARYNTAGYKVYMNSSGYICFDIDSDSTWGSSYYDTACTATSFADSTWHHFEAVRDTTAIYLYMDGLLQSSDTNLAATGTLNSSATLYLGVDSSGSSNYWTGFLDEIEVYPYARSAAQVKTDIPDPSSALFGTSASDPLISGLVAYWKMDETSLNNDCSTPTVMDSSGNSNNAISCPAGSGSTGGSTGKFGNAVTLNGSSQSLKLSGDPFGNYPTAVPNASWGGWFNPSSGSLNNVYLLTKDTVIMLLTDSSGYLECAAYLSGNWTYATTTSSLSTNTWNHVMCTYDGQTLKTFLNGNQVGKTSQIGSITANQYQQLHFGEANSYGFFPGSIDEIRIYNRTLSPAEVSTLYNYSPGPIGWWKLDDNTGTSAADSSGNGNNATLGGGTAAYRPLWTTGKSGSSLNFDGANDYVDATSSTLLKSSAVTVEGWINTTTATDTNYHSIIGTFQTSGGYILARGKSDTCPNSLVWYVSATSSTNLCATTVINDGVWHHIAATYASGQNQKIYIDGHLEGEYVYTTGGIDYTSSGNLTFGAYPNLAASQFFTGNLYEVRVYNYARNSKQIAADMNLSRPAGSTPVGYWKFEESQGETVHNSGSAGSAIDGNLGGTYNTCPGDPGCPSWSNAGKYGKALSFDGSDYVEMPDAPAISFGNSISTQPFSVSAWIKPSSTSAFPILYKGPSTLGDGFEWAFYQNWGGTGIGLELWDFAGNVNIGATASTTAPTSSWSYVAATYDGTGSSGIKIYINGVAQPTTTFSQGSFVAMHDSTNTLFVGTVIPDDGTYGAFATGLIDEPKIYNYALTGQEIKVDYNQSSTATMGSLSNTSQITGTPIPANSSQASYCVPGSADPCSAPMGEWKFDENTGTTAYDTSTNNYYGLLGNGTAANRPVWVVGKSGSALKYDGVNDYVAAFGSDNLLSNVPAFTVSVWAKFNSLSDYTQLINKSGTSTNYISLDLSGSGEGGNDDIEFCMSNGSSVCGYTSTNFIQTGVWYHLEGVYDGSLTGNANRLKLYVNGLQQSLTFTNSEGTVNSVSGTNTNAVVFGDDGAGGGYYLSGVLDSISVYHYARTPAQVAWDYNRGAPLIYYNFDECQGSTIHDTGALGSNAAIGTDRTVGTCSTSSTMWGDAATGKFNSALSFDGTGDSLSTSSSINLSNTTQISVSFWLKWTSYANDDHLALETSSNFNSNTSAFIVDPNSSSSGGGYFEVATHNTGYRSEIFARPSAGVWHHYVLLLDGTTTANDIRVFVDGLEKTTTVLASNTNTINFGNYNWYLMSRAGSSLFGAGQMDDFRVYPYFLTPAQIKTVYNYGSAVRFGP